jgi:hypothetical protein
LKEKKERIAKEKTLLEEQKDKWYATKVSVSPRNHEPVQETSKIGRATFFCSPRNLLSH